MLVMNVMMDYRVGVWLMVTQEEQDAGHECNDRVLSEWLAHGSAGICLHSQ